MELIRRFKVRPALFFSFFCTIHGVCYVAYTMKKVIEMSQNELSSFICRIFSESDSVKFCNPLSPFELKYLNPAKSRIGADEQVLKLYFFECQPTIFYFRVVVFI